MLYAGMFEKTAAGYGALSPEVPGVGAAGQIIAEVAQLIREAIELHLEGDACGTSADTRARAAWNTVDLTPK